MKQQQKLYVNFKKPKTIKEFLIKFYTTNINHFNGLPMASETYKNIECTRIHCDYGRLRSFDDLYDLIKTYYPTTNYKQLFNIIIKLEFTITTPFPRSNININHKIAKFHFQTCSTIRRVVFSTQSLVSISNYGNYYNRTINKPKLNSQKSYAELLEDCKIDEKTLNDLYKLKPIK